MPISPAALIDDSVEPIPSQTVPVPVAPKKIYMDIIRYFTNNFTVQVESSYDSELDVISQNKSTFAFTIGNVKFINFNNSRYNIESDTVERGSFGNGIVRNGNNIDVACGNWTYRINLSNKSAITFSNVNIPAEALAKMI
jgi:hypothetical protein